MTTSTTWACRTCWKSIDKTDDYTVVFKLKEPNAPIIANLAMDFAHDPFGRIRRPLTKAGTPEKIDQEPIGTGPFSIRAYQKDAVIRYKAFRRILGRQGADRRSCFAITTRATARYAKLKAGECHVMIVSQSGRSRSHENDPA